MTDQNPNLKKRDLIMELTSLTQELERPPTREELDQYGEYRYQQYEAVFGDLYTALRESGILPDSITRERFRSSELTAEQPAVERGSNTEKNAASATRDDVRNSEQGTSQDGFQADSSAEMTSKEDRTTKQQPPSESKTPDPIEPVSSGDFAELTNFRRDILIILAGGDVLKGLEIKEELEQYYEEEVNHGRLYPNLDELAEKGLIKKTAIDKRSNGYSLTDSGIIHINARRQWESKGLDWLRTDTILNITEGSDDQKSDQGTEQSKSDDSDVATQSASDTVVEQTKEDNATSTADTSEGLLDQIMNEVENLDKDRSERSDT